jgi:hypothetical protein
LPPYIYDWEPADLRAKFGLDAPHGGKLNFFLWQDRERIGPEHAFEYCWTQYPEQDIIIMHTDMSPMPGDGSNSWYDELLNYRDALPRAGMIACNLFYPRLDPQASLELQCGGGDFENGEITYLHGPVQGEQGGNHGNFLSRTLNQIRSVKWVTFGGVYIRREVLRACGPLDRRYRWAYVMDVDYCFEARLRGFELFQVPVSLQHEENRTTRALWEQDPELLRYKDGNYKIFREKWQPRTLALDTIEKLQHELRSAQAPGADLKLRSPVEDESSTINKWHGIPAVNASTSHSCDPLAHPICFSTPRRIAFSTWAGHVPFAMFLVDLLTPGVVVELGTYSGVSYCAFCQAVKELQIGARCFGVDTWKGDPQCGFYGPEILAELKEHHDPLYASFSRLIQAEFDDAATQFQSGSIDLLHIDGYHTYEAVKHDFRTWLPKLSSRGVVLLHDIRVRYGDYGVWRLWEELSSLYPHFEFDHACGLGLVVVGYDCPDAVQRLCRAEGSDRAFLRYFFSEAGTRLEVLFRAVSERNELRRQVDDRDTTIQLLRTESIDLQRRCDAQGGLPQGGFQGEGQKVLDVVWESASWRLTRPARNLVRWLRGYPPEQKPIPQNDLEVWKTVLTILFSVWWNLTSPLRLAGRIVKKTQMDSSNRETG